jgi:hypothetical protein
MRTHNETFFLFFTVHTSSHISKDDNLYFMTGGAMDEKYLQNRSVNMTLIDHKSKAKMKGKGEKIFFRLKRKIMS